MRTKIAGVVMLCSLMMVGCKGGSLSTFATPNTNGPTFAGTQGVFAGSLGGPIFGASSGKIQHVVIIFQENRTPDNLFHGLPGADIASTGVDSLGRVVPLVPVGLRTNYDIDHSHRGFTAAYNNRLMNGFDKERIVCTFGQCPGATQYAYVPPSQVAPYFTMAQQYTFADRMFQTNEGPSFPAHQYIINRCACPHAASCDVSGVLARGSTLMRCNSARRRISSAAATSAWQVQPHATQRKRLLRRLFASTCRQRPHV